MAHRALMDDEPQGSGKKLKGEAGGELREDEMNRLSDMPDNVLLHIMNFMDTQDAVRTCVLSKRWKNLCKHLSSLTFRPQIKCNVNFENFVSWVLTTRDDSYSLLNLSIYCWDDHESLDSLIKYALCHNVQQLNLQLESSFKPSRYFPAFNPIPLITGCKSLPSIFRCRSLTSLTLCGGVDSKLILPNSLHLPALRSLDLSFVEFTKSDNGCVEPFSNCRVLNTLILDGCSIHNVPNDERVLYISNTTLSYLRIDPGRYSEVVLSTPNLNCLTINGYLLSKLSTACNLACLEEVKVDLSWKNSSDHLLIAWLQVLANVKILTFSSYSLLTLNHNLLDLTSRDPRLPCFARLEAIKLDKCSEFLNKAVEYLLQNTPMARVGIIISD